MQLLSDFDRNLFEDSFLEERWVYAPRAEGQLFALGMVVVGRRHMIEIPVGSCSSESFKEMRSYADFLNQERLARMETDSQKQGINQQPEPADTSSAVA